jgi:hypothetical protein
VSGSNVHHRRADEDGRRILEVEIDAEGDEVAVRIRASDPAEVAVDRHRRGAVGRRRTGEGRRRVVEGGEAPHRPGDRRLVAVGGLHLPEVLGVEREVRDVRRARAEARATTVAGGRFPELTVEITDAIRSTPQPHSA